MDYFFDGANFLPKTGAVAFKLSSTVPRWRSCDGAKMLAEKTARLCGGTKLKKSV